MDPVAGKPAAKGRGLCLGKAFSKSLSLMSASGKGFFLITVGAQIDHGGHDNNLHWPVTEIPGFDQVVGRALEFAGQIGETLVIVTADHETGGLPLFEGDCTIGSVSGQFSTDDHTVLPVPLFVYGPGRDCSRGVYEDTDLFQKIMEVLGMNKK